MRAKLLTFLIALGAIVFAVVSPVKAGSMMLMGVGSAPHAASYQGPGDVFSTSPYAWFSCARAYNGSYAASTGNLCDVVLTSGGAAACTIKAATNGFADLTGTYCAGSVNLPTACAAGCSVSKMYNQISPGTCDVVQATLASMPALLLNSTPTGTLPAVQHRARSVPCRFQPVPQKHSRLPSQA